MNCNEEKIVKWSIKRIQLPLRFDWKISRNTSESKVNFVVDVVDDELSGSGEVAFNVRYSESIESIEAGFMKFAQAEIGTLNYSQLLEQLDVLKLDASLRFGIESAWVALQAAKKCQPIWSFLGVEKPKEVATSFSLPILPVEQIAEFIETHDLTRFSVLKVKVGTHAEASVREVARHFNGKLRIDANEAWQTANEVLAFLKSVEDLAIEFIEQPLPAECYDELLKLKKMSPITLIGDESLTSEGVTEFHRDCFHGVNIKLMKAGGFYSRYWSVESSEGAWFEDNVRMHGRDQPRYFIGIKYFLQSGLC